MEEFGIFQAFHAATSEKSRRVAVVARFSILVGIDGGKPEGAHPRRQ